jgi:hypothetical protein
MASWNARVFLFQFWSFLYMKSARVEADIWYENAEL